MIRMGLTAILLIFFLPSLAYPGEDRQHFALGKNFAKAQQREFAYMQFREIVLHAPGSPLREAALFAIGEYFFSILDIRQAEEIFMQFLKEYPNSKNKIFVLGYLYKIANQQNDLASTEKFKTDIITLQHVSFIFRNSKEYKYHSPLGTQHRAIIRINQITIDSGGEILAEISY